jgi:Ni/Co efflux regulator RcnB
LAIFLSAARKLVIKRRVRGNDSYLSGGSEMKTILIKLIILLAIVVNLVTGPSAFAITVDAGGQQKSGRKEHDRREDRDRENSDRRRNDQQQSNNNNQQQRDNEKRQHFIVRRDKDKDKSN